MSGKKPILCLDFDGVLHAYTSGWQGVDVIPDGPVPGAMFFLLQAVRRFDVCIYSTRSNDPAGIMAMDRAIKEWLDAELLPVQVAEVRWHIKFPAEKPPAMVTIDDRAVTFTGAFPSVEDLLAFKTWQGR
jgi:hypothetical protein